MFVGGDPLRLCFANATESNSGMAKFICFAFKRPSFLTDLSCSRSAYRTEAMDDKRARVTRSPREAEMKKTNRGLQIWETIGSVFGEAESGSIPTKSQICFRLKRQKDEKSRIGQNLKELGSIFC